MTINTSTRIAGPFAGTGLVSAFPFFFKVFQAADLEVVQTDSNGNQTTLTSYVVSLGADQNVNPGGTIVLPAPLPAGYTLVIASAVPATQPGSITNLGGFYPKIIENALDRVTILTQQLSARISQTLRVPEPFGLGALPTAAARALRVLGFGGAGQPMLFPLASGDPLGTFQQNGTRAIIRTGQEKLREIVTPQDFGALADGVTDCTIAVQAAANYAITQGGRLKFLQGTYAMGDINTSGVLHIEAEGAGIAFLKMIGTNRRWKHDMSAVGSMLFVSNVTFMTTGVGVGIGLHVQYTQPGVPFTDRNDRRVFTNNVEFKGIDDNCGWVTPMWLDNIQGSEHIALWMTGINGGTAGNVEADNTITPRGVRITGADYPTDHRFVDPTFYSVGKCIEIEGYAEGVTLENPVAVNVGILATWDLSLSPASGRPGIKIINPHVNSYWGITDLRSIQQAQLALGACYHNPGAEPTLARENFAFTVNTTTDVVATDPTPIFDENEAIIFHGGTPPAPLVADTVYYTRDYALVETPPGSGIYASTFKVCATAATPTTSASAAIDITAVATGACRLHRQAGWIGHNLSNCVEVQVASEQYLRFVDATFAATTRGVRVRGPLTKGVSIVDSKFGTSDIRASPQGRLDIGIDTAGMDPGQVRQANNTFTGQYRISATRNIGNYQVAGQRGFRVEMTLGQSIPNAAATKIAWDAPGYDSMGLWVFGPPTYTDFTIPSHVGITRAMIGAFCSWAPSAAGTYRILEIQINGAAGFGVTDRRPTVTGGVESTTNVVPMQSYPVKGGDVISVRVRQDSGGALSIQGGANRAVLLLEMLT